MRIPPVLVCALPTGYLMVSPLASINTPVVVSTPPVYFTLFHRSSILGLPLLAVPLFVQATARLPSVHSTVHLLLVGLVVQQPKSSKVASLGQVNADIISQSYKTLIVLVR